MSRLNQAAMSVIRTFNAERLLLIGVLALQLLILRRLDSSRRAVSGGAASHPPAAAVQSDATASQSAAGTAPDLWGNMVALDEHVDRRMRDLWDRAMEEFERMEPGIDVDRGWTSVMTSPTMDMRDDGDRYLIFFSLPGLDAARLKVTLEGQLLTIAGDSERRMGGVSESQQMRKSVWLPGPVGDERMVRATVTNGFLRVVLPKGEASVPLVRRLRLL